MRGVLLHGQVERGFIPVRSSDFARDVRAVGLRPARHQPVRRVVRRIGLGQYRVAPLRDPAQHRVDQPGIARAAAVALREPHGKIDRGMVGHIEPEDLRRAGQEDELDARRLGRKALVEQLPEFVPQRAEPAQHGRDKPAHQCAVAVGERGQGGMCAFAGELFVERNSTAQHSFENVDGDLTGGEAGDIRLRRRTGTGHVA